MIHRVLAVDCGTVSGAAVDGERGIPILTSKRLGAIDADDHGARYAVFEQWLCDLIAVHQPTAFAFESPLVPRGNNVLTNANTIRFLLGLAAVAELVGTRAGLEVFEANVQQVKRHFAGNGRADKTAMMQRCRLLGWNAKNHNEADAAGLWALAKSTLDPKFAPQTTPLFGRTPA